ncbi:hypothetical protein BDR05DRAFT_951235 [Suillus weaverae]|nr:hypothetical protein BDR05DRAFT_951235 [Suillus weaverae]
MTPKAEEGFVTDTSVKNLNGSGSSDSKDSHDRRPRFDDTTDSGSDVSRRGSLNLNSQPMQTNDRHHDTYSPSHATSTQPFRVNDMMAHLEPDRVASESPLPSHVSCVRYGGTVLEHLVRVIAAMQNDEKKGSHGGPGRKENISPHHVPKELSPLCVPSTKRICCEKMGTEWQMVLDVIRYGEEVL